MKQRILKYALLLLVVCFGIQQAGAKVWYVNSSTVTWQGKTAGDVKSDIASTITGASDGDEIWVASGTFLFDTPLAITKKISLYGGFVGNESKVSERKKLAGGEDWEFVNATVLDGQKKCRVINMTAANVVFDGFTVIHGKTAGSNDDNDSGAGIHSKSSGGVIQYCIVRENVASKAGGGVSLRGSTIIKYCLVTENNAGTQSGGGIALYSSTPATAENCEVTKNVTTGTGGGIYVYSGTVKNCRITDNTGGDGGGLYLRSSGASNAYNCLIYRNTGTNGGGFACQTADKATLYNCNVVGNTATTKGGGGFYKVTPTDINIKNTLFWGNKQGAALDQITTNNAKMVYCGLEGVTFGEGVTNITLPSDSAAIFAENWGLAAGSPCIDAGTNDVVSVISEDIEGNSRQVGKAVDLGIYEKYLTPDRDNRFYVKSDATGNESGSSWTNAFKDVQSGVNAAYSYKQKSGNAVIVWVAKGEYDLSATLELRSGISIYGGFAGTETKLDDRQMDGKESWEFVNATVLKGNGTSRVVGSDDSFSEATYVDGFTITGGNCKTGNDDAACGAGMHIRSNVFVQNCIITGNSSIKNGGGICLRASGSSECGLANSLIENNNTDAGGGGVALYGNSVKQYIKNCVIRNNTAGTNGGGIFNFQGRVENCSMQGNTAAYGGAIYFRQYSGSSLAINCLMEGNTATKGGAVYFLSKDKANLYNSTVVCNTTTDGSSHSIVYEEAPTAVGVANSIFWKNKNGGVFEQTYPENTGMRYCAFQTTSVPAGEGNVAIVDSASFWGKEWQLAETSAAKDAGVSDDIAVSVVLDIAGAMRVQSGKIDMGCYESGVIYKPDVNGIFYVKSDGNDDKVGDSWDNALKSIDLALEKAKFYNNNLVSGKVRAKIWIAGGTYKLANSLAVVDGISMFGGFAGTEKSLDERERNTEDKWDFKHLSKFEYIGLKTKDQPVVEAVTYAVETEYNGLVFTGAARGISLAGKVSMRNCIIQNNGILNEQDGAGVKADGENVLVEACLIEENQGHNGAGVLLSGKAVLRNSLIRNNKARNSGSGSAYDQGWGGGVFNNQGQLENCVITGNTAVHGGGVFVRHASSGFYNCLVADNTATKTGGGVAFSSFNSDHIAAVKTARIYNFTIVNNTAEESAEGAGVYFSSSEQKVVNTILYGNTKSGTAQQYAVKSGVSATFVTCALQTDEEVSKGNIAFSDPATVFTDAVSHDWTLCVNSVCEDKGTSVDACPETALGGNLRKQGKTMDIGAYERDSDFEYGPSADGIVYVVLGQDGQGKAWNDAVGDLNQAIAIAKGYNDALTDNKQKKAQVWVKTGEYQLSESVIINSGVAVYGGFAGSEKTLGERAKGEKGWDYVYPTVLKGVDKTFAVILQQADFSEETTIDGFTVEEGMPGVILLKNALLKCCIIRNSKSRTNNMTLPGGAIINNNAGGVFIKFASVVDSCLIENNSASSSGGGIYAENNAGIKIKNCLVQNNISNAMGGGIFSWQATVENCIVRNNTATTNGGGIVVRQTTSVYYNCIVEGNTAKGKGGGIWFKDDNNQAVNAMVYNMTVVNNKAGGNGGGVYFGWAGQTLVNTILWGNTCKEEAEQYAVKSGVTATFTNCAASTTLPAGNVTLSQDSAKIFAENWTLCEGSPCIDKGKDVAGLPDRDVYGSRRLSGEGYDIGACEYLTSLQYVADANGVFYVNKDKEMGRGDSWDSPIKDLATAVLAAKAWSAEFKVNTQIWVAKGIYFLPTTLNISTKVAVYGGFAGTEVSVEERRLKANGKSWDFENEVVLDGGLKVRVVNITADGVVFDGFTLTNGVTTATADDDGCGAGIHTKQGGVKILNCIVKKNKSSKSGGGIALRSNSDGTVVENCFVTQNNSGTNPGGGITMYSGSNVIVKNSLITDNNGGQGGGIYVYRGNVENCMISGNTGTEAGGVYLRGSGACILYNCLINRNTASLLAGGMTCQVANNASIYNCTVTNNIGGGLYYKLTPTGIPVVNSIFWGNKKNESILEFEAAQGQSFKNASLTYTAFDGDALLAGTGNIALTQDSAAIFATGWTLDILSPCVDKGNNDVTGMPEKDLAGNSRKSNEVIDLGAYEYQSDLDSLKIDFERETIVLKSTPAIELECSENRSIWNKEEFSSLISREKRVIYCRVSGTEAPVYEVGLPGRYYPAAVVDFANEELTGVIANSTWDITGSETGVTGNVSLSTYVDADQLSFTLKQPATGRAFKTDSLYQLPTRKEAPELTLSFVDEALKAISAEVDMTQYEVSKDNKLWNNLVAQGSVALLIPALEDFDLYVRTKSSDTTFASRICKWELKGRPASPDYSINFADSMTMEVVPLTVEYDTSGTFVTKVLGEGSVLRIEPGKNYYFRVAASDEEEVFVSLVDTLKVPTVANMEDIRIDYREEKLIGLTEHTYWKVDGGEVAVAQENISALISAEADMTLTLYVPQTASSFASAPANILLPKREAAPEYIVDHAEEVILEPTDQITPDNWEIKLPKASGYVKLDESGALRSYIPAVGQNAMAFSLRTAAGVDAFCSQACDVTLSARPATPLFTIDFSTEKTKDEVIATLEYSQFDDMEMAVAGGDTAVVLEPEIDLYFRTKATSGEFASGIFRLIVPKRPAINEVAIDFEKKELVDLPGGTLWQVNDGEEANAQIDLTHIIPAAGKADAVLKIWVPETDASFRSDIINLNLPAYPANPELSIDYEKEELTGVLPGMKWSYHSVVVGKDTIYAANSSITGLIPTYGEGELTVKVWVAVSKNNFRSVGDVTMIIPARQEDLTQLHIDYLAEKTQETISADINYVYESDPNNWILGANGQVVLKPGERMLFKRLADQNQKKFASRASLFTVPARPVITIDNQETELLEELFIPEMWNSWTNTVEDIVLSTDDPEIAVAAGNTLKLLKSGKCNLTASLPAVAGEHFAAEPQTVTLKVGAGNTGTEELNVSKLKIAGRSDMIFKIPELEGVSGVRLVVFNMKGKVIYEAKEYGQNYDMGGLDAGTYYYLLTYPVDGKQRQKKGFVEIIR